MNLEDQNAYPVSINSLSVKFGENYTLSDVTFRVNAGEYLGIIGPNGGGKSTLLKTIMGLVKPCAGNVEIARNGRSAGRIGYVPQSTDIDKSFPITVQETVLTGMLAYGSPFFRKYSKEERKTADDLMEETGIFSLKKRYINELSGGEFQKTLIARALAVNPGLLLLDEPTSNVDSRSMEQIYALFGKLRGRITIILVTHDLLAVSSHVGTIACLNRRLVYHGKAELNNEIIGSMYNCPVDLIAHGVPHRVLKEHADD